MDSEKDYYKILEVHEKASKEEITKNWKRLIKKYHPDKVSESEKLKYSQITLLLNEAYDCLVDDEKRKNYVKSNYSSHNEKINSMKNDLEKAKKEFLNQMKEFNEKEEKRVREMEEKQKREEEEKKKKKLEEEIKLEEERKKQQEEWRKQQEEIMMIQRKNEEKIKNQYSFRNTQHNYHANNSYPNYPHHFQNHNLDTHTSVPPFSHNLNHFQSQMNYQIHSQPPHHFQNHNLDPQMYQHTNVPPYSHNVDHSQSQMNYPYNLKMMIDYQKSDLENNLLVVTDGTYFKEIFLLEEWINSDSLIKKMEISNYQFSHKKQYWEIQFQKNKVHSKNELQNEIYVLECELEERSKDFQKRNEELIKLKKDLKNLKILNQSK